MPKKFKSKSKIQAGEKKMKLPERKNFCEICEADFSTRPNMWKHKRLIHKLIKTDSGEEHFPCPVCKKVLPKASDLKKHTEDLHPEAVLPVKKEKRVTKIECAADCGESFKTYSSYANHLKAQHDISIEVESLSFDSQCEFETWKEQIKDAHYVKECGTYRSKDKKIVYYRCHRSYSGNITSGKRTKYKGSVKINRACPSHMKVSHVQDEIKVQFYRTHVGHVREIGMIPLQMPQKVKLSEKLAAGVPMDTILEEIRLSADSSEDLERIHLVNRIDLHNISKQFGLGSSVTSHRTPSVSVDITVEDFKEQFGEVVLGAESATVILEPVEVPDRIPPIDKIRSKVDKIMKIVHERTFAKEHSLIVNRCLDDLIDILSIPSIELSQMPRNLTGDSSLKDDADEFHCSPEEMAHEL